MMMFLIYGLTFYLGAVFNREYNLDMRDMFASIFAILYASFGAGNNAQFMVDEGKAKNAAKSIFKILDSKDEFEIHH
jgi:ATP-binding cassette, subfamily B (MDR/TAP), member 1